MAVENVSAVPEARSLSASTLIERIASAASSSVFIYDLAEHAGFGGKTREWSTSHGGSPNVVTLQTRAGAGLSLIGRLSEEGTSKDVQKDTVLTAYNTPSGLAIMAPSFPFLPSPTASSRLVLQIPTITPTGPNLVFSPTLAPFTPVLFTLPDTFSVILSSSPQELVDLAAVSYSVTDSHVIHLFDHFSAGREIGNNLIEKEPIRSRTSTLTLEDALKGAGYSLFDYVGDKQATHVVVLLNGPLAAAAKAFVKENSDLGVVIVRVVRPWNDSAFLATLPTTVQVIHVLDEVPTEGSQSNLYMDVFASSLESEVVKPSVRAVRLTPSRIQGYIKSPSTFSQFLQRLVPGNVTGPLISPNEKKILFVGTPNSPFSPLPEHVFKTFLPNEKIITRFISDSDIFTKPGGISVARLTLSPRSVDNQYVPLHVSIPVGAAGDEISDADKIDLLSVLDQSLLKTHALAKYLKQNAALLLLSTWSASELSSNLPPDVLEVIRNNSIRVYLINPKALADGFPGLPHGHLANVFAYLAFLRLYLGQAASEPLLRKLSHAIYRDTLVNANLDKVNAKAWAALEEVDVSESVVDPSDVITTLKDFEFNAINVDLGEIQSTLPGAYLSSWHDAARHILFQDVFVPPEGQRTSTDGEHKQNPALRPEISDRTYLVTCSVNRRLTPLDYDRNVFHLEFDTSGTGLKYAIGEALGVHGWNDADEVLDFCSWYGVDPDRLITIPVPGADGKTHTRTIFQALQQQIDIFGHPPKSFYSSLSDHATKKQDKLSLQFIGSAEGSSMYKKLSEKDTVTFADVLKKYASARPSIEVLCDLVGDIKPRHYSIASSQAVVGDRVDLLVVTVEWAAPSGSPRYGQCTRYLAGLKVGQKVTVSIKPSVMKLPPDNMQPLILAGLGTGAAPFRAFLQYRAWLAAQNIPVGPLYYYFGSRHRSKEYLYGEEIEAFIEDGTITRAGLAFSRDTKKKIYIQHKMLEDAKELARMLYKDNGVFYLCGPTWPVPDVYEALVGALVKYDNLSPTDAGDYLEGLKEEERYVLEVY